MDLGTGEKVILSVEDDHAAYALLELGFDEVGGDFRLYRVVDGEAALAFLRQEASYAQAPRPDLVLLNLNMPRLSGMEVLHEVNSDASLQDTAIVVFSSSSMDTEKATCLALGARQFITKPTNLNDFFTVLRNVCALVP